MAMTAVASGNIETGHQGSLSVQFEENGIGFADVAFSIYRVADISEDGTYTLTGDFAQYPVRMENLDSSGWRALAQTLDAYAARDEIASLMTRQTGPDGSFQITGLSTGLYLISGGQYIDEDIVYTRSLCWYLFPDCLRTVHGYMIQTFPVNLSVRTRQIRL